MVCGNGGVCRVFVTSTTHQGDLFNGQSSGLAGADSLCQQRAGAASLPGAHKAWLSDFTDSPATRFMRSPGPHQLVTGTTVATSWNDLTNGALATAITVDEHGNTIPSSPLPWVWTNTSADGTQASSDRYLHCGSWGTSSDRLDGIPVYGIVGWANASATNEAFTAATNKRCNEFHHLCSFQQS